MTFKVSAKKRLILEVYFSMCMAAVFLKLHENKWNWKLEVGMLFLVINIFSPPGNLLVLFLYKA